MSVQIERLKKGWTQEQLALVSGLSVRTIQRIERGETASVESLKSLAAAFDVDFSTLREPAMTEISAPAASSLDAELLIAVDHVRQKRRLQIGLVAYGLVIPMLVAINVFLAPRHPWAIYPAFFWGLGLAFKALRLSGYSVWGPAWERRELEKRLGRPL